MDNVIPFPENRSDNKPIVESRSADVIEFPKYNRHVNLSNKQFPPKIENKAYIEGMRELRKSNAAGTHLDKRNKRARTRLDSRTKAIQESQDNG